MSSEDTDNISQRCANQGLLYSEFCYAVNFALAMSSNQTKKIKAFPVQIQEEDWYNLKRECYYKNKIAVFKSKNAFIILCLQSKKNVGHSKV